LGISISATTIATVLRVSGLGPAPRRIGPSWSEFLRAQAQSMLDAGLPSEPGRDLAGNAAARGAPSPEQRSSDASEEPWSPLSVPGRARLSAVAAAPPSCDSTAAPLRSSRQWRARDGPRTRRRSLHARTVPTVCQSRRPHAPGVRAATTARVPQGGPRQALTSRGAQRARDWSEPPTELSFFTPQVRRIHRQRARGDSFRRIASDLNQAGVPTAQGGAEWYPATVRHVLLRTS